MGDEKKSAEVTMPFSLTDGMKATREALNLLKDLVSMVGSVSGAYQQHKGKQAADQIDTLVFGSDGSRRHLERIAAGGGHPEDFDAIVQKMDSTGTQVESALSKLTSNRTFIRKHFGAQLANTIDRLIHAEQGKKSIRLDLMLLAGMEHIHYSPDDIAAEARLILSDIERLNGELAEVHDILAGFDNT